MVVEKQKGMVKVMGAENKWAEIGNSISEVKKWNEIRKAVLAMAAGGYNSLTGVNVEQSWKVANMAASEELWIGLMENLLSANTPEEYMDAVKETAMELYAEVVKRW